MRFCQWVLAFGGARFASLDNRRWLSPQPVWPTQSLQEEFMCPACIASAGVVVGSVVSTGGLTALVARILRKKKGEKTVSKEKE